MESATVLKDVSSIDVVTVPVLSQLSSDSRSGETPKKFSLVNSANGSEIFQVLDISGDPNIRGLVLALPNQKSVLHCGYIFSATMPNLELASPSGAVAVFRNDSCAPGLISAILCPCLCLWWCLPTATASIKNPTGEEILVANTHASCPKNTVVLSRPKHLGGSEIGSILFKEMYQSAKVTFKECASPDEKLLVTGIAVGIMDYDQLRLARVKDPRGTYPGGG